MNSWYDFDLEIHLQSMIDLWEQDCRGYWYNQGDDDIFKRAEKFAKAVFHSTKTLLYPEEIEYDILPFETEWLDKPQLDKERRESRSSAFITFCDKYLKQNPYPKNGTQEEQENWSEHFKNAYRAFEDNVGVPPPDLNPQDEDSPLRPVWDSLVIAQAEDAICKIDDGASRMLNLYRLVLRNKPSETTQAFLSRLGRCYVWGFDSECVMLCRSIIDTAFKDTIEEEICKKHGQQRYDLSNRIWAAFKERIICKDIKDKALKVKTRGDKAVHDQPDITKQIWETLCITVEVLESLYRK